MALSSVSAGAFGLRTQAWVNASVPDPRRFHKPAPTGTPSSKPNDGFFTSTWDEGRRSCSWLDFLPTTTRQVHPHERLWTFTPDPDAILFVIDSLDDYMRLADEYPQRNQNPRNPVYAPAWHQIAMIEPLPFDAVHATASAIADGKSQSAKDYPKFEGWGVESTLWFAWRLSTHVCVGAIADDWTLAGG